MLTSRTNVPCSHVSARTSISFVVARTHIPCNDIYSHLSILFLNVHTAISARRVSSHTKFLVSAHTKAFLCTTALSCSKGSCAKRAVGVFDVEGFKVKVLLLQHINFVDLTNSSCAVKSHEESTYLAQLMVKAGNVRPVCLSIFGMFSQYCAKNFSAQSPLTLLS